MAKSVIERIFSVEEDPRILEFKTYDGIPIWMMSRYYFLYNILFSRMLRFDSPTRLRELNATAISTIIKTVGYNISHQSLKKRKTILLYTTNRKTTVDSKFFNRYTDQLALVYPDETLTIEQALLNWEWPFPRANNCVYFDINSRIIGEIRSRLGSKRDVPQIVELVDYVASKANDLCDIHFSDKDKQVHISYIEKVIISMRYQAKWIEKQSTKDTKLFVMVGGAYPFSYPINKVLKEKGIKTADLQHGYITKSNLMYNYSEGIVHHPDVVQGLPDYFLTYGDYWNTQFNCPSKKVSIGNPYNDLSMKKDKTAVRNDTSGKDRFITLFGTGENTDHYISLTQFIAKHFDGKYRVKFRPHPGERKYVEQFLTDHSIDISVDSNIEVYDTLKESEIIISEISTVLFEAVGIVKRILVWQTDYSKEYFPDPPFETFENDDEVIELICSKNEPPSFDSHYFWADKWEHNYKKFISEIER